MKRLLLLLILTSLPVLAAITTGNVGTLIVQSEAVAEHGSIVVSVAANADDAQIVAANFYSAGENSDGVGWAGYAGGSLQYDSFSFVLSSDIGASIDVTNVSIRIYGQAADSWVNGTDDLIILFTDSADAPVPDAQDDKPVEASGNTATCTNVATWLNVTWNTAGWNTCATNLLLAFNELIDKHSGFSSGERVCVWVRGVFGTEHYIGAELYEHASSNPAEITIQW